MRFDAIQVHSAPEALVEQIIDQIRSGAVSPGAGLPAQRELAQMFQVGLGTVREAFKILHAMGFVEVFRGKGTFVARDALDLLNEAPTIDQALEAVSLVELMKAREVVERCAARMAAENANAESLRNLRRAIARMATVGADDRAYYEADFHFHLAVARASESRAIYEIVKLLVDKGHHHITFMKTALAISAPPTAAACMDSATAVVDHIEAEDPDGAAAAMLAHLNTVNQELLREFPGKAPSQNGRRAHFRGKRWPRPARL